MFSLSEIRTGYSIHPNSAEEKAMVYLRDFFLRVRPFCRTRRPVCSKYIICVRPMEQSLATLADWGDNVMQMTYMHEGNRIYDAFVRNRTTGTVTSYLQRGSATLSTTVHLRCIIRHQSYNGMLVD